MFDRPDVAAIMEALSCDEIDQLPFGAIKLDKDDRVVFYSKREAIASGMGERGQVGRDFFKDIAPCFATDEFLGLVAEARSAPDFSMELYKIGDFADSEAELHIRLFSTHDQALWMLIERESDMVAAN
ncbi:hypothetical protein [Novosphingobium olei]|uniref:Photoactive yellow protein n=1 Tax=Novosphingobium olei TaxID=2728851 RepID=A0A7Y0BPB3_9SPHN|nr:hypothetical protein [Novosphingobium olei]NML93989.1 hypothetical protein [Novosphingobium olei]BEV01190.1 PAS domain-containing protein [Novosphingobium olei]